MRRLAGLFLGRPGMRREQLDALDGLRGLAVLIVLASHFANAGLDLLPGPTMAGTGKSGVYLFFVLSAFLLARPLVSRPPAGFADGRLWADYALRRVLRIWPLYLAILLLSWAMTRAGVTAWHYSLDTAALLRHLALREGQSVLWSIPVEFVFYLFLPAFALLWAWTRQRRWPLWLEAASWAGLVLLAQLAWPPEETRVNDVRLGPYLVVFICGVFAARLDSRLREGDRTFPPAFWAAVGLSAIAALVLTIPSIWARLVSAPFDPAVNHTWFLLFGAAWSALLLAVLHGPAALRAPFAWAPARWVGVVSFSVYLWHMPVLDGLRSAGPVTGATVAWLALAAILGVSAVSFLIFERPFREVRLRRSA